MFKSYFKDIQYMGFLVKLTFLSEGTICKITYGVSILDDTSICGGQEIFLSG